MKGWEQDKKRADVFMPTIKQILGRLFIGEAPVREDQEQATDLMVFTIPPLTVACRMRNLFYLERYPNDITIRYSRPSGVKTEYDKIVDGWADFFFYGFGDFETGKIHAYKVLTLKALRATFIRDRNLRYVIKPNKDGSSQLMCLDVTSLPIECVCHSYPASPVIQTAMPVQRPALNHEVWAASQDALFDL